MSNVNDVGDVFLSGHITISASVLPTNPNMIIGPIIQTRTTKCIKSHWYFVSSFRPFDAIVVTRDVKLSTSKFVTFSMFVCNWLLVATTVVQTFWQKVYMKPLCFYLIVSLRFCSVSLHISTSKVLCLKIKNCQFLILSI